MKKYQITWEERYRMTVNANSEQEAKEVFEGLDRTDMDRAYQETTYLGVEETK